MLCINLQSKWFIYWICAYVMQIKLKRYHTVQVYHICAMRTFISLEHMSNLVCWSNNVASKLSLCSFVLLAKPYPIHTKPVTNQVNAKQNIHIRDVNSLEIAFLGQESQFPGLD